MPLELQRMLKNSFLAFSLVKGGYKKRDICGKFRKFINING